MQLRHTTEPGLGAKVPGLHGWHAGWPLAALAEPGLHGVDVVEPAVTCLHVHLALEKLSGELDKCRYNGGTGAASKVT